MPRAASRFAGRAGGGRSCAVPGAQPPKSSGENCCCGTGAEEGRRSAPSCCMGVCGAWECSRSAATAARSLADCDALAGRPSLRDCGCVETARAGASLGLGACSLCRRSSPTIAASAFFRCRSQRRPRYLRAKRCIASAALVSTKYPAASRRTRGSGDVKTLNMLSRSEIACSYFASAAETVSSGHSKSNGVPPNFDDDALRESFRGARRLRCASPDIEAS
mmetsp:Transcript_30391/g.104964  ORF Transcript_30391/g.104964 Transcript_30391/m.104964 type:complete len:221 (+) Transcript_30391:182-844(+)